MTREMMKTGATFEETWPRYQFAPLVGLVLALAGRITAADRPKAESRAGTAHGTGPVYR